MQLNSSMVAGSSFRLSIVFVLATASACAQVSASLSGTVTDQTGATLSGSAITAKNVDTGAVRGTETDAEGRYQFFSLPVGQYEIRSGKVGFKEEVRTGAPPGCRPARYGRHGTGGGKVEPERCGDRRRATSGGNDGEHNGPGW